MIVKGIDDLEPDDAALPIEDIVEEDLQNEDVLAAGRFKSLIRIRNLIKTGSSAIGKRYFDYQSIDIHVNNLRFPFCYF